MTEKSEKAYEKVIGYIQEEIWKGNLKRGERLPPERDLAEKLGVSRNSVREALRTLGLMGFIDSKHGAGNFVSCDFEKNLSESFRLMLLLGETNYLQVSQLRRGLEAETARLAASHILPGQLAHLEALSARMRTEADPVKAAQCDQEFHSLLCEASGNRLIRALFGAMISNVNDFIGTMYVRIAEDEQKAPLLHDAHEKIVDALRRHAPEDAIQAIWAHFEIVDSVIL